jgi:hypothetical protein
MTTYDNRDRAERARNALEAYIEARGEAFENSSTEIVDLIADLLHLNRRSRRRPRSHRQHAPPGSHALRGRARRARRCSMSALPLKRFRVVVIEWLSHDAVIEAPTAQAAEAEARRLWDENAEHEVFSFDDSGIDGIQVEEVSP